MNFLRKTTALALLSCALSFSAWAKRVVLYENGKPVPEYNKRIKTIEPGDEVVFPEMTFKATHVYPSGSQTKVFSTGDGKVVRVPLDSGLIQSRRWREELRTYDMLEFFGLPAPHLYRADSSPYYRVFEEMPKIARPLPDVLAHFQKLPLDEQAALKKAVLDFSLKSAEIDVIGDMMPYHFAWDGKRLWFFDWTGSRIMEDVAHPQYDTIFDFYQTIRFFARNISPDFTMEMRRRVKQERAKSLLVRVREDDRILPQLPEHELERYVDMEILFGKWASLKSLEELESQNPEILSSLQKSPRYPVWEKSLQEPMDSAKRFELLQRTHPRLAATPQTPPRPIVLFNPDGTRANDYAERIRGAQKGDELVFPDKTFQIERRYEPGANTAVFAVGDGKVLRAPIRPQHEDNLRLFQDYKNGYDVLEFFGVGTPKFYRSESTNHYLIVEEMRHYEPLYETLLKFHTLSHEEQNAVKAALLKFAADTAVLKIGDLHLYHLAWDGHRLRLYDWTQISLLDKLPHKDALPNVFWEPMLKDVSNNISKEFAAQVRAKIMDSALSSVFFRAQADKKYLLSVSEAELERYADAQILFGNWKKFKSLEEMDWRDTPVLDRLKKSPRYPLWEQTLKNTPSLDSPSRFEFMSKHPRASAGDCTSLIDTLEGAH